MVFASHLLLYFCVRERSRELCPGRFRHYNRYTMKTFQIVDLENPEFRQTVLQKIDDLTKPKSSLGRLEELAAQVCMIQHTLFPHLNRPYNILFAADHGIVEER